MRVRTVVLAGAQSNRFESVSVFAHCGEQGQQYNEGCRRWPTCLQVVVSCDCICSARALTIRWMGQRTEASASTRGFLLVMSLVAVSGM